MSLVIGVDIGNSTTEACVAEVSGGAVGRLASSLTATTGVKGTPANTAGAVTAVRRALEAAGRPAGDLATVLLNEATPVISGLAMETITETVITESTMIGHNPETPGGEGIGVGTTVPLDGLGGTAAGSPVVVVVAAGADFDDVAERLNRASDRGVVVVAAVLHGDDAVLVVNRLRHRIPVVDEVSAVERVPLGMLAAVEVAPPGRTIRTLSDSYGLASTFDLDAEQTRQVSPVARALSGNRSAVVVRTPAGDVTDRRIPVGTLTLSGSGRTLDVGVDDGADAIMDAVARVAPLTDVHGEPGTHVGGMLANVRDTMTDVTGQPASEIRIRDVLAVDTVVPAAVRGGLAGEVSRENAVALAAMVRTSRSRMQAVAGALAAELGCDTVIGGVEAEVAVRGALTTPGSSVPIAIVDMGGGSTDAALLDADGTVSTVHVAGAGELVTRLIGSELGIDDREAAESVKRHPLAKVESFFHVRHEDGSVQFFGEPLPPHVFAKVVTVTPDGLAAVPVRGSLEEVRRVRRAAKQRVFVVNALRALAQVAPQGSLRLLGSVVLLGGSALDFEIPAMVADALAPYGVVCGIGNVHGTEGPRNAVAAGLVDAHAGVAAGTTRRAGHRVAT
ncbi:MULTISPECIES: diol dehydratase reactivase subunit alpha [unclassified Pseudonocardia]|uniref:diol dehydratase reactivase subunit alpha n=1 Tax=unclassified Pseudonocardia TaxID=2619320 RepID=UPI0001FFF2FA|nr:diol dehydratase reactivase subunit alpha [Pseudonocardia sp. Ae707_Ps1]OLM19910.1 Propanediol dehydratase reactivation factor large subunit [Pseudonocardia sp. Ae707_Ps1]